MFIVAYRLDPLPQIPSGSPGRPRSRPTCVIPRPARLRAVDRLAFPGRLSGGATGGLFDGCFQRSSQQKDRVCPRRAHPHTSCYLITTFLRSNESIHEASSSSRSPSRSYPHRWSLYCSVHSTESSVIRCAFGPKSTVRICAYRRPHVLWIGHSASLTCRYLSQYVSFHLYMRTHIPLTSSFGQTRRVLGHPTPRTCS